MSSFWPTDDGWLYPDSGIEEADASAEPDDDLLSLRLSPAHLLDGLDDIERAVITGRYGLGGAPARSVKELRRELGLPPAAVRGALGSGLSKLRHNLTS